MPKSAHALRKTITPEISEKLFMLRESYRVKVQAGDALGDWWRGLFVENRRMLLAWSGNDDSPENAARPWAQLPEDTKKTVLQTGRNWARMFEPINHVWWVD